ncbi:hypothetical protein VFPPC_16678 [Pochonia chlamydosporia 170]|uniref:Uncharacterized protein n=1 Tax=Pochonia chlamydosporia 170 TaxID=1380566 RepID=A0A179F754_METCM|nr:hypothetical protein VFPPC_16678 [Pochonia chlamydosporia 170]OAQ60929.1 hypothetical protein VFPPC_16678 [Pochonia chlamydosporia 170]
MQGRNRMLRPAPIRPTNQPAAEPTTETRAQVASYYCKQQELRTARQKHRRKVFKVVRRGYFEKEDDEKLRNQLQGIHISTKMQRNADIPPERHRLAAILGDFDDDLSEKQVVERKVDAINAVVAYSSNCINAIAKTHHVPAKEASLAFAGHNTGARIMI